MTRFYSYILIFIMMISCSDSYPQLKRIPLNNWTFRNTRDTLYMPAIVPGTVHTDLMTNGVIEDPFYRDNEKKVQWVEKEDWLYRTEFNLEDPNDGFKREIVFKGLDTYAEIILNGTKVLSANNMFREFRVTLLNEYLNKGANILEILFRSPLSVEDSLAKIFKHETGISNLPVQERVFTRKAAYHYGWDWSPRFVTCGIWRDVYIEAYKEARLGDILVTTVLTDDLKEAHLLFNTLTFSETDNIYDVEIINKSDKIVYKTQSNSVFDMTISNPKLWWSNGLGEQNMYDFEVILKNTEGAILDTKTLRTGIRKIELVQANDVFGKSFYFKLNNVPAFMKGANWIPADNFLPRVTKDKYRKLIGMAKDANMNMLRVWGGGIYEDEEFYKQCDENGIMVWQDFMYACAMYPWSNDFLQNAELEAAYNLTRLNNHPCIALWCGNNEIDEGWQNWGWQNNYSNKQKELIWGGYEKLFKRTIPEVMDLMNIRVPYVSSSPQTGWGKKESMAQGDSHYWGVWWGMEKFDTLESKVPRFMSEYGFQGFPDTSTLNKFTIREDRYLFSEVLKMHQKHPTGYEILSKYMKMYDIETKDYEQYIWNTQDLQIYCLKTAIEAQRISKPRCMGTLLWQFNDCNPVVSWSIIDYFITPKPSYEFVKELYAETVLLPKEKDGKVSVYIVSDKQAEQSASLMVLDYREEILDSISVVIPANSSAQYYEYDLDKSYYRDVEFRLVLNDGKLISKKYPY